jgi:hypothetical protein
VLRPIKLDSLRQSPEALQRVRRHVRSPDSWARGEADCRAASESYHRFRASSPAASATRPPPQERRTEPAGYTAAKGKSTLWDCRELTRAVLANEAVGA